MNAITEFTFIEYETPEAGIARIYVDNAPADKRTSADFADARR